MNARAPLERIVVAGAGVTGCLTALALRRALPRAMIALLHAPADPAALADRLPALFPLARAVLEARVGLDEDQLVAAGVANRRFADAFEDWGAPRWLRALGRPGGDVGPSVFHQHWLDARRRGRALDYHRYHPAAQARPDAGGIGARPPFDRADHALRLDPAGVVRLLARPIAAARIATPSAPVTDARAAGGAVTAALLADGSGIEADLFVDCTGPAARLHAACDEGFEPWDAIGCDRVLIADAPAGDPHHDRTIALPIGWRGALPLPGRTVDLLGWSSAHAAEGRARRSFGHGAAAEAVTIRAGRRSRPFVGNVVALGDAAVQPGPMGALGLTLALGALDLLVELLPGRVIDPGERAEFNRRAALQADRMRDFAALPLCTPLPIAGPFWQAKARTVPASLAALLAQFGRRGLVPRPEEDLLETHDWISALIGFGFMPEVASPVSVGSDPDRVDGALAALARAIAPGGQAAPFTLAGRR